MSLQSLSSWLVLGSIIFPLLGGLCGIGAWYVSGKLDEERKIKIESLEKATKLRHISNDQRVTLLTALTKCPKGKVWITAPDGDQECKAYAAQISEVFRFAGLDAEWGGQMGVRFDSGVSIFSEGAANEKTTSGIQEAFKAAGIDCPRSARSTLNDHALINVMVGIRK